PLPPPGSTPFPYTTLFRSHRIGPDRRVFLLRRVVANHSVAMERLAEEFTLEVGDEPEAATANRIRFNACRFDRLAIRQHQLPSGDRKSTRLNSSHVSISYA